MLNLSTILPLKILDFTYDAFQHLRYIVPLAKGSVYYNVSAVDRLLAMSPV